MKGNTTYKAYLLTGSNLGDSINFLQQAATWVEKKCGVIKATSSYYKTAAWGLKEQPDFINQALAIETSLSPEDLMKSILAIEKQMGRERLMKMGPRVIDIDILIIDGIIKDSDLLKLPHPHLAERRFALIPLAEIAPTLLHTVEKKTVLQLLQDCKDDLDVQKIS